MLVRLRDQEAARENKPGSLFLDRNRLSPVTGLALLAGIML